jgi:hypothetical protein
VIVGLDLALPRVVRVYLWQDGRMASADRIHRQPPGSPAWREAEDTFGLSNPSLYPLTEYGLTSAAMYASKLERDLANGAAFSVAS